MPNRIRLLYFSTFAKPNIITDTNCLINEIKNGKKD